MDVLARGLAARAFTAASRTPIAVAVLGQSNERGQVTPTETVGGVASRIAYPQAFASQRNPTFRYPVGPAGSLAGGYHFRLYDDLYDAGFDPQIVNASIGSMSMVRDAAGQILDIAAWRGLGVRQQRTADVPGDMGYVGDYGIAAGKLFVCTTGRRAYAFHEGTFIPNDTAIFQNLDFIREIGTHTTAASAPDFSSVGVNGTVVDGSVTWTCVSASNNYLGYNYGVGACSETRAGFDPFGILRRCHKEMGRVRTARVRTVVLANGQSDTSQTSGVYQGAINSIASFFANRGYTVHLGLSVYNPSGNSTAGYETLSAALGASYTFLTKDVASGGAGFSTDQVKAGPNLYKLLGSTGDMAAGGAYFAKDAGQDNIHLNARGAIAAGAMIAQALLAWLRPAPVVVPAPALPAKTLLNAMASTASLASVPAGASDTANSDNPMGQANVLQFVPPAANTHYFLTIPLAFPTDLRNGTIELTVKHAANIGNLNAFDVELHSSATIGTPTSDYSGVLGWNDGVTLMKNGSTGSGATAGRWQTVAFSTGVVAEGGATRVAGAGADLSQIRWLRLRIRSASGQPVVQFQFGPVRFQRNPLSRAKLILCFDDAHISQYNTALPAIRAKGWAGVLFPGAVQAVIDSDATKLTTAQLQQMQAEGWQIASQAWSAENVQSQAEVDALKAWMQARGLTGGGFGSYFSAIGPRSLANWPVFRDNYRAVRSFDSARALNPPLVFGESYPWPDSGWVHALAADASGGGASGFRTAHIDQAIANKGVALMVWHSDMTGLQEVLDYADANRGQIDVVTEAALFASFSAAT